ncbi:MAG: hypothetical protein ACLFP6_00270 [Spirochaetaceae bacterium]
MRAPLRRVATLLSGWLIWSAMFLLTMAVTAPGGGTIWDGWYTLLVCEGRDLFETHARLTEDGGPAVVSLVNATARYQGFPELEAVSVGEIEGRFDPADPRYDPYLRSLGRFFRTSGPDGSYHLLMVEKERSVPQLLTLLRRRLGQGFGRGWPATGGDWILLDALGANSLLFVLLFALWAGVLLFFFPSLMVPGVPILLSFLPLAATGAVGAVSGGLILFGVLHLLQRSRGEVRKLDIPGPVRILRAVAVGDALPLVWATIAVLALFITGGDPGGVALMGGATLLLAASAFILTLLTDYLRYASFEHHPFTSVRILTRRYGAPPPGPGMGGILWGAGGLLALLAVAVMVPPVQTAPVPAPTEPLGGSVTYPALNRVFDPVAELPTLAGYVAHRAFQETILYGGEYRMPEEGEEVSLATYDLLEGRLVERREVILTFDQQWLDGVLSSGSEYTGVHSVLLSQPRISGVEQATFDRLYLASLKPAPLAGAVVFAFSPFFLYGLALVRNPGARSTKREA